MSGVSVDLGDATVLAELSFSVEGGTVTALLGPSGCGKTTLLRAIAGLAHPKCGEIRIGDRVVQASRLSVPSEKRRVGMVFQDGALFEHMTVAANVGFGLPRAERKGPRVREALELVGLGDLAGRMPGTLSGGQAQRVALARAIAPRPDVLLLDEPFAHLDANLRRDVRDEVQRLLEEIGITTIVVTHDRDEAFLLGHRIAVMTDGGIVQHDVPEAVYANPVTPWVARFVGETNLVAATGSGGQARCCLGTLQTRPPLEGQQVILIRPEQIEVRPSRARLTPPTSTGSASEDRTPTQNLGSEQWINATVTGRHFVGPVIRLEVQCDAPPRRNSTVQELHKSLRSVAQRTRTGGETSDGKLLVVTPSSFDHTDAQVGQSVEIRAVKRTFPAYPL